MRLLPVIMALAILLLGLDWGRTASAEAVAQGDAETTITANASLLGDANCSGSVDAVDALQVLRSVAGLPVSADCLPASGDTDCSATIDAIDALRILRFVASLSNTTPAGCVPIGSSMGPPVSSFQLIDEALDANKINLATALLYKAYAAFQDGRLPDEYHGNDTLVQENPFINAVPAAWDALSQNEKDALMPFLLPPNAPGSWDEQQQAGAALSPAASDWDTVESAKLPVKVWYHPGRVDDEARAASFLAALDGKIWDSLTNLMEKTPLPDCGATCPSGGGDDRFDIYLVDPSVRSYVMWNPPETPDCSKTPAFMVLAAGDSNVVLAHELMHAIQFAFDGPADCWEYRWFREASAQWAMDYVYPKDNEEQKMTYSFLPIPDYQLDLVNDSHEYGAYLYPFFLVREFNRPQIVRDIWKTAEDAKLPSLAAINQVTSGDGGFERLWPQFTLRNWNTEPVDDYKQWDGLNDRARAVEMTLSDGGIGIHTTVNYLAATYYHFKFIDEARAVTFQNWSFPANVKISALVNIGGQWQDPQDWTSEKKKSFCRDNPSQDIQEMVLVISNTDWQGKKPVNLDGPTVQAYTTGCEAWEGWIDAQYRYYDATYSTHLDYVRFEVAPNTEGLPTQTYLWTKSSPIVWTVSGTWPGGCIPSGQLTINGPGQEGPPNYSAGYLEVNRPNQTYKGLAQGFVDGAKFDLSCPGGNTQQIWPGMIMWDTDITTQLPMSQNGKLIEGEYTNPKVDYGGTWKWHLTPAP